MIEVQSLCKVYGKKTVLDDLSFRVEPGTITGFVGPNGAGKSTTMKIIMGLEAATSGAALVDGKPFSQAANPTKTLGCCLGPEFMPQKMRGADFLSYVCRVSGIQDADVDSALDYVGLGGAGRKRISEYSLGMRQRLGIAAALMGDPDNLMFDEPINGLDVDAIRWVRGMFAALAARGKTVFISSHIMSELEKVADRVIIIQNGRVTRDGSIEELERREAKGLVVALRSTRVHEVAELVSGAGVTCKLEGDTLLIDGMPPAQVGAMVYGNGLTLDYLEAKRMNLEELFMETKEGENE